jgi:hypothetical protein
MKNYNLSKATQYPLKVYLMNAHDTIKRDFLVYLILWSGGLLSAFPPLGSILVSTRLNGFFSEGSGLSNGDPMSPYLSVLVMEAQVLLKM